MNTTARIESSGAGGKIHVSQECADELIKFNKDSWVVPRKEQVHAKGKGILRTFWLRIHDDDVDSDSGETVSSDDTGSDHEQSNSMVKLDLTAPQTVQPTWTKDMESIGHDKTNRLITWHTETLKRLLERVVAQRDARSLYRDPDLDEGAIDKKLRSGGMVFDEVAEMINLPNYDQASAEAFESLQLKELDREIVMQIREYVTAISKLYQKSNEFHSFDHCSHGMFPRRISIV